MHRILVNHDALCESIPELSGAAERHLKVLRLRNGEQVELFDGAGHFRVYAYDAASRKLQSTGDVTAEPVCVQPPRPLVLFACVTKGSRWDWTIEKATELGVTRIVPVISERTIVRISEDDKAAKRERWSRIAEDAARQSDARWLPAIEEPCDFDAVLEKARATCCFVGALTNPPSPILSLQARKMLSQSKLPAAIFVGPEGDFSPEELAALLTVAHPTSFGSTILRAETAAIYALSVVKGFLDAQ